MLSQAGSSSTLDIPQVSEVPRHVAIIMDGNGRWAKNRMLPRVAGHRRGVKTVREITKICIDRGVEHLTLFAFSSENWRRPLDEVSFLMKLFVSALRSEVGRLHKNGIRFKVIGDVSRFELLLVELIREAEALTANNTRLTLTVAVNYGGRWDIVQAVNRLLHNRENSKEPVSEAELSACLEMAYAPEPDLFIRTGGEKRISNFLLWQLAYTELYFTDTLWPDFGEAVFDEAIQSYKNRERRFGRTSEQLQADSSGNNNNA